MDSKQIPKTPSPHDQFFKGMFSQAEIAIEYIRNFLPEEIWQDFQIDKLRLDGASSVIWFQIISLNSQIFDLNIFHNSYNTKRAFHQQKGRMRLRLSIF